MYAGLSKQAEAADGTPIYFETYGEPAKPAIFLGPHYYATRIQPDESFSDDWISALAQDFFLIVADYPRGLGRTKNPQGLSFSPDIAAQEYVRIAAAAGVERFAWLGYSFGAAMGLQLACRTDRLTALAIGGFPPLNAPFKRMRDISQRMARAAPSLPAFIEPGVLWTTVGFYSALVSWPERQEISKLMLPRLVYMGDRDEAQGLVERVPLADLLRSAEWQLRDLGWKLVWLAGHDHISARRPEISLALVSEFFREALASP